jgi:hypothetical protein
MRSWRRNRETGLEAELRAYRPEPSRELVHKIETHVRELGRTTRAGSFRLAFVAAIVLGMLMALASFGGLGYAATGAGQAVSKARQIVHVHGVTQLHRTAARDQYSKPRAKCRKGTRRVRGVCKKIKKARGVRFRRPPFTG